MVPYRVAAINSGHLCQTAVATSDGHGSTLNVVVYFLSMFFGLFYEIRDNKKLIVICQLNYIFVNQIL